MFNMKVESQLNLHDRTMVCGKPVFDTVPEAVDVDGETFVVIGISHGIKLPFMSLEISKTNEKLVGKNIMQST